MNEEILQFGSFGDLVGILSPISENTTAPVALMFNAGVLHRVGPFRLWVDLARQLALHGIPSLRFDLHGLGDSPALESSSKSPLEQAISDLQEAMNEVERRLGKRDFIVIGLCSGADYAHPAAIADPRIRGLVMIDGYGYKTRRFHLNRVLNRVFNFRRWRNFIKRMLLARGPNSLEAFKGDETREFPDRQQIETEIQSFLNQGRRLCFVYTGGVPEYYNDRRQFWEMFPTLRPSDHLQYSYFGKTDHTFALYEDRQQLLARLVKFVTGCEMK